MFRFSLELVLWYPVTISTVLLPSLEMLKSSKVHRIFRHYEKEPDLRCLALSPFDVQSQGDLYIKTDDSLFDNFYLLAKKFIFCSYSKIFMYPYSLLTATIFSMG